MSKNYKSSLLKPRSVNLSGQKTGQIYETGDNSFPCWSEESIDQETHSSLKIGYEEVLTTEEAAKYLKVSVGSLRNMTSNGQIPYHKLGGRNRYFREDLRKLLLANRRGGLNGL